MTDLETRLLNERRRVAEGYEIPGSRAAGAYGFDAGIAFMREVVAEKDAEIARLEARLRDELDAWHRIRSNPVAALCEARESLGNEVKVGDSLAVPLELEHRRFGFDRAVEVATVEIERLKLELLIAVGIARRSPHSPAR